MKITVRTRLGLALVGFLIGLAATAPIVAPNSPIEQFDETAGRHLPPLSSRFAIRLDDGRGRLADSVEILPDGVRIERLDRLEFIAFDQMAEESRADPSRRRFYLLGTDKFGRDVWSRLARGARITLAIGVLAALIAMSIGLLVGATAALTKSWLDGLLMRLVDGVLMFPRIFLLIAIAAFAGSSTFLVIVILGCTSWMSVARLARAELLTVTRRDYVQAARSSGASSGRVFFRHLLPNSVQPVLIDTTLRIGDLILLEAALSFLGLGVPAPTPSWGGMIFDGSADPAGAWWVAFFPGIAIAATVVGFNLLGEGVRDLLDPRTSTRIEA